MFDFFIGTSIFDIDVSLSSGVAPWRAMCSILSSAQTNASILVSGFQPIATRIHAAQVA